MKQGRKLKRWMKELLTAKNLNPDNWLVMRNLTHLGYLHLVHRYTGKERIVKV